MSKLPAKVPAHAKLLLDFIGGIEAPKGYGAIYGNNQGKLAKPLTQMTYGEIVHEQVTWTKRFKSSAAGRYQFCATPLSASRRKSPTCAATFCSRRICRISSATICCCGAD